MSVIPAVIPTSRHHLDTTLSMLGEFTDSIQVDVVDGIFIGEPSWPFKGHAELTDELAFVDFSHLKIEFDLMIKNPECTLNMWLRTGAERLVVHVESTESLDEVLKHRSENLYMLGLGFNNETSLDLLKTLDLGLVDFVQLMGIAQIGVQGQPFDDRVLDRIRFIKDMYPDMPVSVDGSVNHDTVPMLRSAGVDRFVSGSAILKANDLAKSYEQLLQLSAGNV